MFGFNWLLKREPKNDIFAIAEKAIDDRDYETLARVAEKLEEHFPKKSYLAEPIYDIACILIKQEAHFDISMSLLRSVVVKSKSGSLLSDRATKTYLDGAFAVKNPDSRMELYEELFVGTYQQEELAGDIASTVVYHELQLSQADRSYAAIENASKYTLPHSYAQIDSVKYLVKEMSQICTEVCADQDSFEVVFFDGLKDAIQSKISHKNVLQCYVDELFEFMDGVQSVDRQINFANSTISLFASCPDFQKAAILKFLNYTKQIESPSDRIDVRQDYAHKYDVTDKKNELFLRALVLENISDLKTVDNLSVRADVFLDGVLVSSNKPALCESRFEDYIDTIKKFPEKDYRIKKLLHGAWEIHRYVNEHTAHKFSQVIKQEVQQEILSVAEGHDHNAVKARIDYSKALYRRNHIVGYLEELALGNMIDQALLLDDKEEAMNTFHYVMINTAKKTGLHHKCVGHMIDCAPLIYAPLECAKFIVDLDKPNNYPVSLQKKLAMAFAKEIGKIEKSEDKFSMFYNVCWKNSEPTVLRTAATQLALEIVPPDHSGEHMLNTLGYIAKNGNTEQHRKKARKILDQQQRKGEAQKAAKKAGDPNASASSVPIILPEPTRRGASSYVTTRRTFSFIIDIHRRG